MNEKTEKSINEKIERSINEKIERSIVDIVIEARARKIVKEIGKYFDTILSVPPVYIGGGSLTGEINDIDVFPVGGYDVPIVNTNKLTIASSTKNATTYIGAKWPIQICNYRHNSLEELVNSFDFAHIQVGARVSFSSPNSDIVVYYTKNFVESRAVGTTWFCGSQYPLSSLIRAGKYYKRNEMPKGSYIRCVLDCLLAISRRGFVDYNDFKDQLDAVDLGLVPEEISDVSKCSLLELFELFKK